MTRTATLRRQHDIILEKAQAVQDFTRTLDDADGVRRMVREFRLFDGVLTAHLNSEDSFLYPEMIADSDTVTSATAHRFSAEMGGLAMSYADFVKEWVGEAPVLADPEGFRRELRKFVFALSNRIHRENSELYPLADAMQGADGSDQSARRRA